MRIYYGIAGKDTTDQQVCVVDTEGTKLGDGKSEGHFKPLNPRLDLANHSPTGLSWGYGGSGPAQTALAILADATGDDGAAVNLHQAFKWRMIASLPQGVTWCISDAVVRMTWSYMPLIGVSSGLISTHVWPSLRATAGSSAAG